MKVLVANRSEIACRVFQACRELGLRTVGVQAPGDEQARHLTYADEVFPVDSYLDAFSLVAVAQRSGATLVHPGYGFLSERPAFADAIEKAGLTFVGPTAESMELLGEKIAAKELAARAGVPTLPWAKVVRGRDLQRMASTVGFPLLLKAAAGGGGKGMRRVGRAEDLEAAAESASAEAQAAFGDGTLFLERLVERPRHIEVQVFGDGAGGGVHLYERDCSLQRRHQKVWEEACAPHLAESTRKGILEAALALVRAVKYRSAGTVEFLLDDGGKFYFLEMNTRLQVEHPVTELVTGVDLVHAQLEEAMARGGAKGKRPSRTILPEPFSPRGHAIEVRLYAEDPSQGFAPTPGRIERLRWPTGAGIRVDSGIEEGQEIGTLFDPMLAKLIVHAPDRAKAIARLRFALEETVALGSRGFGTNQVYLRALCDHPAVMDGRVHTKFLETELASFAPVPSEDELALLASARAAGAGRRSEAALGTWSGAASHVSPWSAFGPQGGASA